jgi:hypothetical protein
MDGIANVGRVVNTTADKNFCSSFSSFSFEKAVLIFRPIAISAKQTNAKIRQNLMMVGLQ